jgi:two-component system KDP operon response regulator KdpE
MIGVSQPNVSDPVTILLVEDDAGLRRTLAATLKAAGYKVVQAVNGQEALRWHAHYRPDMVLLDLGLPDHDGIVIIDAIRARGSTPIVVLTARDFEAAKVEALDRGADDYVTKPFSVPELLARIRAALRHGVQTRGSTPIVTADDIEIDLAARRVKRGDHVVRLSPKEFDVLAELALQQGRPVRHGDLLKAVWGSERADLHYLRVYIGQLRAKLETNPREPKLILAEPGIGYRLA